MATPAPAGLRLALAATRPQFLTASVLPVLIGTAWGWRTAGRLDMTGFLLAIVATTLVHAASNVYNDVSDEVQGTDRANTGALRPFTGGSGLIQSGAISLAAMQSLALRLLLAGGAVGLLLAWLRGWGVLAFGAAGIALGLLYSLPGARLSGRGLGEPAIAVAFGLLPVAGAAWIQSGTVDATALLLAVPVAAWVMAIIVANGIPDAGADAVTGKRTLAVRLGRRTPLLHGLAQALAAGACVGVVATGMAPGWSLAIPGLLLAMGLAAARDLHGDRLLRGIRLTLAVHGLGCLWLLGVVLLSWPD